jgi:hypothetical protein
MQPNEKTNEKINQQLSAQPNEQPKKTWEDPAMTTLDVNGGFYANQNETGTYGRSQLVK